MPRCIVRYRATLVPRRVPWVAEPEAVVRMEEWREADEWGDPGRLIARRFLRVEGPRNYAWTDALTSREGRFWEVLVIARIGPVVWAEEP